MLAADDAQHCVHAALAVVCYRAPEQVSARDELQLAVDDLAGLHAREPEDVRAADAAQVEVVRVLAAVDELDDHAAGPHLGAREAVAELLRDHLDTRRRMLRLAERGSCDELRPREGGCFWDHGGGVDPEPLLEQGRIDASEI